MKTHQAMDGKVVKIHQAMDGVIVTIHQVIVIHRAMYGEVSTVQASRPSAMATSRTTVEGLVPSLDIHAEEGTHWKAPPIESASPPGNGQAHNQSAGVSLNFDLPNV